MTHDIAIIGGGNAALCAAMTAAEAGAKVLILETAPKPCRGGNSRHTRNFRCLHEGPLGPLTDSYGEDEYLADLLKVIGGETDEHLARLAIRTSAVCLPWMQAHDVRFQPPLSGTLSFARTNAFFMGGGKSLVNAFYRTAEGLGVNVHYEAHVTHLELDGDHIAWVDHTHENQTHRITPKAVIVAAGGFQADIDWLTHAWGPAAQNFQIRGTPYNRGVVLADLLAQGVQSVGDPTQCHAVAIDGRAPKFDGGIVTRLDCVSFSIVVNKHGERFYDEGEDVWPKRYAIWGRPITEPPFYGYTLRPGVTFTYLGLKVDENAQCSTDTGPIRILWAAGETMAGSILGKGYLAGFGMTIGTVFGRIAGREAAAHVN